MILRVAITTEEWEALQRASDCEIRPLSGQLRYILRQELERRGLLPATEATAGDTPTGGGSPCPTRN
jgi:hypothetical protein